MTDFKTMVEQDSYEEMMNFIKFGSDDKMIVKIHSTPCEPRQMIGKSWWKQVGYNTPCSCAVQAGIMMGWTIKNMNDYKYSYDFD